MDLGNCKNANEAAENLQQLRPYSPFRFGGVWYISVSHGIGVAFRSKASLIKRVESDNLKAAAKGLPPQAAIEILKLSPVKEKKQ